MKTILFYFFLFFLLLKLCKCAYYPFEVYDRSGPIRSPAHIVTGSIPYQVAIMQRVYNFDILDGKKFRCSGSLIDAQWVLTSAQCVEDPELFLLLGTNNIRDVETFHMYFDVTREDIIVHPEYSKRVHENDIALIKLPQPVSFNSHIQAIQLAEASNEAYVNKSAYISGWSKTSPFTPASDFLRQETVSVMSNRKCRERFKKPYFFIRCSHLCTDSVEVISDIDKCVEDQGAPLVVRNTKKSRIEQIGIDSKPNRACKRSHPSIYTRISSYREWIDEVIKTK